MKMMIGGDYVNAYDYLEQIKTEDAKIDAKRAEEQELWALATTMTQNYSGMPKGSGNDDKMTVIVGGNGIGKTSIMEALAILACFEG